MELLTVILLSVSIFFSVIACIYGMVCYALLTRTLKGLRSVADSHKETLKYFKARDNTEINTVKEVLELKITKLAKTVSHQLNYQNDRADAFKDNTEEHIKRIYSILKGAGEGKLQPEEIVKMIDDTGVLKEEELDKIVVDRLEEVAKKEIQYVGE